MPFIARKSFHYVEVIIIVSIYLLLTLWIHPTDPLLLNTVIPFSLILLIVITLYYGLTKGVVAIAMMSVVYLFNYDDGSINKLLTYLLLTLISGQFFHYWHKNYIKSKEEVNFLKSRLDELSTSFYMLKISHDELEKDYVLSSQSLRRSIGNIQDIFFKDGSYYESFLHLMSKSYNVRGATIAIKKGSSFKSVCSIDGQKNIDKKDLLVQKSFQHHKMAYINGDNENKKSKYIAVIPYIRDGNIQGVMTIDKMPFMDFNQKNLISISILFAYFLSQVKLWDTMQKDGYKHINQDVLFDYYYKTLYTLNKTYSIPTAVLVFKPRDILMQDKLEKILKKSLRKTDHYKTITISSQKIVIVVLPLTTSSTADIVSNKFLYDSHIDPTNIAYMGFDISQNEIIKEFIIQKSNL